MTTDLFITNVGSHMWRMERPDSDVDLFRAFIVPTKMILMGKHHKDSDFKQKDGVDTASHEIGVVISQLLKGNVNYLWGVMSPLVVERRADYLDELREIMQKGMAKNCFNSIRGLAIHNYKKYIEAGKVEGDKMTKKCNTVVRTLRFGTGILEGKGFQFGPVADMKPDDVQKAIGELEAANENSSLPDSPPNEDEFREFLLGLRLRELEGLI
jgi:predicted nucleotidyltransferase